MMGHLEYLHSLHPVVVVVDALFVVVVVVVSGSVSGWSPVE